MSLFNTDLLEHTYNELKKAFVTKDAETLYEMVLYFADVLAEHDQTMTAKQWHATYFQSFRMRMLKMSPVEANFKNFHECDLFQISPNVTAVRAMDRTPMMGEDFLFFRLNDKGHWSWCQNSKIIEYEQLEDIDDEQLYLYREAMS